MAKKTTKTDSASRLQTLQVVVRKNTKASLREVGVRVQTGQQPKRLRSAG